jgi:transcriptional regulator with XRE-family HTH domain
MVKPEEIHRLIGQWIRAQRLQAQVKQTAAAYALGVSEADINDFESGHQAIPLCKLAVLFELYRTPENELQKFFINVQAQSK